MDNQWCGFGAGLFANHATTTTKKCFSNRPKLSMSDMSDNDSSNMTWILLKTAFSIFAQKSCFWYIFNRKHPTDLYYWCVFQMEKIFILLKNHRLEKYYNKFIELGIKEELDFFDSVNDETLKSMGMSSIRKKLFFGFFF